MARDLGRDGGEVHQADIGEAATEVIRFWLEEVPPDKRFARDAALDAACRERFGALRDEVIAAHAAGWRQDAETLLAAIILIDQFSRNIFRDDARAYEGDPLARALARFGIVKGWDRGLTPEQRQFLYMPLMHGESMADQVQSSRLFANSPNTPFAERHAAQIARFGRFPQRNAPLGRKTTAAEEAFLSRPDARF
ncbi:MAG TPA: DUF924 family protein [Sphingomonas sp.]|nr:DUF924 family protein [Sphingomonas sp.]